MKKAKVVTLVAGLLCCGLIVSCDQSADKMAAAESECAQKATTISGFNPANPPSTKSEAGKGAAYGAVGGAALGAITGSNSRKVLGGAAVGAAAGAGIAAIRGSEKKKTAAQAKDNYQREYQDCLAEKGF
ncbi:hypothetical protein ACFL1C_06280 [Pseudomonadota bacterium]|jgi:hypothetical protein